MYIVCSRADDIRDEARRWDEEESRRKKLRDKQSSMYDVDRDRVFAKVEDAVRSALPKVDMYLEINCEYPRFGGSNGVSIKVEDPNFNQSSRKALSWSWSAYLTKDGQVIKDTGSWSGLDATSEDKLDYLEDVLKVLRALNSMDWPTILSQTLPNANDYLTEDSRSQGQRPNFDSQIAEAEISDLVGTDTLIIGHGYKFYNQRADVGYRILKESPAQYTVEEIYLRNGVDGPIHEADINVGSYRIAKNTFMQVINTPIQTREV